MALLALCAGTTLSVQAGADGDPRTVKPIEVRMAGSQGKSRLVIEAASIGEHKVDFQPAASRLVISFAKIGRSESLDRLKPWLAPLAKQSWIRSLRSRWQSGSYTALLNLSGIKAVRAFVLPSSPERPGDRLVVDFEHSAAISTSPYRASAPVKASAPVAAAPAPASSGEERIDALVERLAGKGRGQRRIDARQPWKSPAAGRSLVIVIDAGHGGKDPGALGSSNREPYEKHHALTYARSLASAINKRKGMRAVLTRKDDTYITLSDRVRIATAAKADLFVSVHADSFPDKKARGSSVYALSLNGATSKTAQLLADNANATLGFGELRLGGHEPMVAETLVDLAQTSSISRSLEFGGKLLDRIGRFQTLHSSRVQQANFHVLRTTEYPAVLVEIGFISNPGDERKIASKPFRGKMVSAIVSSIEDFFLLNPPSGTYFAQQ